MLGFLTCPLKSWIVVSTLILWESESLESLRMIELSLEPWQLQRVLHHQGELRSIHPLYYQPVDFFHVIFSCSIWMHPGKINGWNVKITSLKRNVIFQTLIFGFHNTFSRGLNSKHGKTWENQGTLIIAGLQVRAAGAGYWEAVWVAKVWKSVWTRNKPFKKIIKDIWFPARNRPFQDFGWSFTSL